MSLGVVDAAAPRLQVGENHRFLITSDGRPFFWLGDTAWKLFHRLKREEADKCLENRAKKGFTVIQPVAISELDGPTDPIPYGYLPLIDRGIVSSRQTHQSVASRE
jgi:hypothetical protein